MSEFWLTSLLFSKGRQPCCAERKYAAGWHLSRDYLSSVDDNAYVVDCDILQAETFYGNFNGLPSSDVYNGKYKI